MRNNVMNQPLRMARQVNKQVSQRIRDMEAPDMSRQIRQLRQIQRRVGRMLRRNQQVRVPLKIGIPLALVLLPLASQVLAAAVLVLALLAWYKFVGEISVTGVRA